MDWIYIALVLAFFAATWGLLRLCGVLGGDR